MVNVKRKKTAAPGQAYGYLVQVVRVLWHLLRASPGDIVAFETLGDVTVESGGAVVSEEDKSGLTHNPIADSSVALWKTFANWAEARRDGTLPAGCRYILYVAQPYNGAIAQRLSDCCSLPEAKDVTKSLRSKYHGSAPSADNVNDSALLGKQLSRLFSHSDDAIASIIVDFTLEKGISSPIAEVRAEIARSASEEHVDEITENLLGWVNRKVMSQVEDKVPVKIPYNDFRQQRLNILRRLDRNVIGLPEYDTEPTKEQIAEHLAGRTYVKQLSLLKIYDDNAEQHINDYLRASATRTEWSEAGYLDAKSFERYEKDLIERWRICKMYLDSASASKDLVERGVELLFKCISESSRIQALDVPPYFLRGSYHSIADEPRIGWHPDYKKLLFDKGNKVDDTGEGDVA